MGVRLHVPLKKCQLPNLFSKVRLARQWLHANQFLSLVEASSNQKRASWSQVLYFQWWKNFWILHWWKKYFPCCFPPHQPQLHPPLHPTPPPNICYHQAPLCTASLLWDEKASSSAAVATSSISLNHLLTSQSFHISGKWIFFLACFLSLLPLLLHAGCSRILKFWRAGLYKKYSSKYKG